MERSPVGANKVLLTERLQERRRRDEDAYRQAQASRGLRGLSRAFLE